MATSANNPSSSTTSTSRKRRREDKDDVPDVEDNDASRTPWITCKRARPTANKEEKKEKEKKKDVVVTVVVWDEAQKQRYVYEKKMQIVSTSEAEEQGRQLFQAKFGDANVTCDLESIVVQDFADWWQAQLEALQDRVQALEKKDSWVETWDRDEFL